MLRILLSTFHQASLFSSSILSLADDHEQGRTSDYLEKEGIHGKQEKFNKELDQAQIRILIVAVTATSLSSFLAARS
jgi:hypothetical protein